MYHSGALQSSHALQQTLEKRETALQWHFKQTAKPPGRKKSGLVLK